MSFPYNDQGQQLSQGGILAGVADVSAGLGVFRVSSLTAAGSSTGVSANQSLSSLGLEGTAFLGQVSAIVKNYPLTVSGTVSAFVNQGTVSAYSPDASLFRISSIGATTTSNDILIDGRNNAVSATIIAQTSLLSAIATSARDSLLVRNQSLEADQVRVSAIVDSGSISARSADANQVHISAVQGDAGLFHVSAFTGAQNFTVSAVNSDGGTLHVSAFIDSGSISAKNQDANFMHVSGFSPDAGLFHVSGFTSTATNFPVSATQGDGSLLRVSSLNSGVTTSTGGLSFFSTSAGIAQTSTVKNAAGRLYGWYLGNPAGVDQYLQIFNASGGATLGTDAPAMTLYVPTLGGANVILMPGLAMTNGIQIAATSTAAGNTAGVSGLRVNLFYA